MKGVDDVKNGVHDKTENLIDTSNDPPTMFFRQIHGVFSLLSFFPYICCLMPVEKAPWVPQNFAKNITGIDFGNAGDKPHTYAQSVKILQLPPFFQTCWALTSVYH